MCRRLIYLSSFVLVLSIASKGRPASDPDPADGAVCEDTWVSLGWSPGAFAVSHDVYFGDSYDDVYAGTGGTFQGNVTDTWYLIGLAGFPYPDGLVRGTTYYWRIDDVNDLHPDSPWRGDVWSFVVQPKTAFNPDPVDGAWFVDTDVALAWTPGFGAIWHDVYFGEDFDAVATADPGSPEYKGLQALDANDHYPGPLDLGTTYYWRIDEFDGAATHNGDTWSFTTIGDPAATNPYPADGATDVPVDVTLTWKAGSAAASHDIYFGTDFAAVAAADPGSPEYRGPQALDANDYNPGPLDLGTTYYWRIDEVNEPHPDSPWVGNVWSLTTIGDPAATNPHPADGATDVPVDVTLTWKAGSTAASHDIYFGTDFAAVAAADPGSPEYKGSQVFDANSYDPGVLAPDTDYYWRVDEFDGASTHEGDTWSYKTLPENVPPVADAGEDQTVAAGDQVILDGSASADPDGDDLSFSWSLLSVPEGSLTEIASPAAAETSFIADVVGAYIANLVVNDGSVDSEPAMVTITAVLPEEAATETLFHIVLTIDVIPPEALHNEHAATPLIRKIDAVSKMIAEGRYEEALDKLNNDLIPKLDGCTRNGEPDDTDWLRTCEDQEMVYPLIMRVIDLLERLI